MKRVQSLFIFLLSTFTTYKHYHLKKKKTREVVLKWMGNRNYHCS